MLAEPAQPLSKAAAPGPQAPRLHAEGRGSWHPLAKAAGPSRRPRPRGARPRLAGGTGLPRTRAQAGLGSPRQGRAPACSPHSGLSSSYALSFSPEAEQLGESLLAASSPSSAPLEQRRREPGYSKPVHRASSQWTGRVNEEDASRGVTAKFAAPDDAFAIVGAVVELASRQIRTGVPGDPRELEPVVERLSLGLMAAGDRP